jgi:hypothetical protein
MSSDRPSPQSFATTLDDTNIHFDPYRDSIDTADPNKINAQRDSVREVGRPARSWRQVLTALSPWSSASSEDALSLLSDQPLRKNRSCRSRYFRGLRRVFIGILIML